jgi:hypothetical protein
MDKKTVPLKPVRPEGLTLADITVTWTERQPDGSERVRTVTGRQLAHMLTAAAEGTPADEALGEREQATERWSYKLRGLSYLVFPDAGRSVHEDDARALVSDMLERAAAEIAADALDSETWAKRYRVEFRTPSGKAS